MKCSTCDELLQSYERAVKRYARAASDLKGLLGNDFKVALETAEALHRACVKIKQGLVTHWESNHARRRLPKIAKA